MLASIREEMRLNNTTVGLVWRKIPQISQYKLGATMPSQGSFDQWTKHFLDTYDHDVEECNALLERHRGVLIESGCQHVFVAPEAVGAIKKKIFDSLLSELQRHTILIVPSWADFGTQNFVSQAVREAALKQIYIATTAHKALLQISVNDLETVHKSWVTATLTPSNAGNLQKREQVIRLITSGLSPEEIQQELGISRSTYYRYSSNLHSAGDLLKRLHIYSAEGHSDEMIMALLNIDEELYKELTSKDALKDL